MGASVTKQSHVRKMGELKKTEVVFFSYSGMHRVLAFRDPCVTKPSCIQFEHLGCF